MLDLGRDLLELRPMNEAALLQLLEFAAQYARRHRLAKAVLEQRRAKLAVAVRPSVQNP